MAVGLQEQEEEVGNLKTLEVGKVEGVEEEEEEVEGPLRWVSMGLEEVGNPWSAVG